MLSEEQRKAFSIIVGGCRNYRIALGWKVEFAWRKLKKADRLWWSCVLPVFPTRREAMEYGRSHARDDEMIRAVRVVVQETNSETWPVIKAFHDELEEKACAEFFQKCIG